MSKTTAEEDREAILKAISKHPNTRFAKLFREVDEAPSQKNIVLLLIELTQQKDFYVDFQVSLQYFLNLYERLDAENKEFLFNEAGLLVFNASQVYSRRVDCVVQRLEDQLAELSSGQEKTSDETTAEAEKEKEKPKRRKRLAENIDLFDIEVVSRKYRKLLPAKRFTGGTKLDTSKLLLTSDMHTENYIHPALWKYSEVIDLDNQERESKKNYRLFTAQVEHRYHTLMPDINFRLYYKTKDFVDFGESALCQDSNWPPLSQEYINRYLKLEEEALALDRNEEMVKLKPLIETANTNKPRSTDNIEENTSKINEEPMLCVDENVDKSQMLTSNNDSTVPLQADSGIGESFLELSTDNDKNTSEIDRSTQSEEHNQTCSSNNETSVENMEVEGGHVNQVEDSSKTDAVNLNSSESASEVPTDVNTTVTEAMKLQNTETDAEVIANQDSTNSTIIPNENNNPTEEKADSKDMPQQEAEQKITAEPFEIVVHIKNDTNGNCVSSNKCDSLCPTTDEGVYFSDVDDSPLTPITIHLDLGEINEGEQKTYDLPKEHEQIEWPMKLNIFEFPPNVLRKMRRKRLLTTLGEDMDLFLKSRNYKRSRIAQIDAPRFKKTSLCWNALSPLSPSDSDLLGFSENGDAILRFSNKNKDLMQAISMADNIRLSRDSGVENDLLTASPEKNTMFFPPASKDQGDARRNLFENSDNKALEDGVHEDNLADSTEEVQEQNSEDLTNSVRTAEQQVVETAPTENMVPESDCQDSSIPTSEEVTRKKSSETKLLTIPEDSDFGSLNLNEHIELDENIAAKIQKWHKHLQPILAHSSQRHHFDVFEIGTNIVNEFGDSNSITFQNVMDKQDPSYVSRYFLSTLLLANQGNLELNAINKSDSKPSEWQDLQLKLINRTRHVVSMEDNIGLPSVKTVEEKKLNLPTTSKVTKYKMQSPPAKKRCVNVNMNTIEMVKPIGKVSRRSLDYDSGIYSNDDFDNV